MAFTEHRVSDVAYALDAYELRTRSIRIHGVVTSVGLENFCWEVLTQIAHHNTLTANQQIVQLHDNYLRGRTGAGNFSSFLRVYCMQFLAHALEDRDGSMATSRRFASVLPCQHR